MNGAVRSILFHRGTEWDGTVRGSTNVIARRLLAKGYAVTWLGRPIHVGHLLLRRGSPPVRQWSCGPQRAPDGALVLTPLTLVPRPQRGPLGARVVDLQAKLAYATIRPSLARALDDASQPRPDVVWTVGGDGGALRRAFPRARRVVQVVDAYDAFGGQRQKLEESDYADADAVVAIGHALAQILRRERGVPDAKLHVVAPGADLESYEQPLPVPADLAPLPAPRFTWVGVIDKADPALMAEASLAADAAGGSVVLIGPPCAWARDLAVRRPNVHLLGPKAPEHVPAYLRHSQVGLMLYDQGRTDKYAGQNPLKLYEMAAAGLPILSTPHAEYAHVPPPCMVLTRVEEVRPAVSDALARAHELSRSSLAFAAASSWASRVAQVERILGDLASGGRA